MNQQTPITNKTLEALAAKWVKIISYQEFATFIWPPRAEPIRRVNEFLRDDQLQHKLGINTDKVVFAIVDFKDEPKVAKGELYADILWELSRELRDKGRLVEESDAMLLLKHLEREGYRVVIIIMGLNRMLEANDISLVKEIILIYKRFHNMTVINFLRMYLNSSIRQALSEELIFTANLVYVPIYSKEDSAQFIRFCEESWNMHITDDARTFILDNFAGKLGTVKNAMRILREEPSINLSDIKNDPSTIDRGKFTLQALDPEVFSVIQQIQTGSYTEKTTDKPVIEYLIKIGMLKNEKGVFNIYPPFLRDIRLELLPSKTMDASLLQSAKTITRLLTSQEQRVFEYLCEHIGEVVQRKTIAFSMWESDVDEHYSDWAIDQLMYRLRGKLKQARVPYELKTKRGRGFILLDIR